MEEQTVVKTQQVTTAPQQVVRTVTQVSPPPIKTEHPQQVYEKKKFIFRTYQVVWYIIAIIEVLLGFRMVLKALGANPVNGFTSAVYTVSDPLALPFHGILGMSVSGNSVFEWTTIIAGIVYLLIGYGIVHMLQFMKPVTPSEVAETVDH